MIEYKKANILKADTEAVINTVNCVGVMGRGIALQFKNAFPENFRAYEAACKRREVQVGKMFVFETGSLTNPRYIINFPTKRHWRDKSQIDDIESGLLDLVKEIQARNIRSVSIPPLGCGLGGLKWDDVRPRIEAALSAIPNLDVVIFEPNDTLEQAYSFGSKADPVMTAGRAALLVLMGRYLAGFMDTGITLLEVHKLLYFLQEAGEPLRLKYVKALYGPYAENLRHVLRNMEGHFISGYKNQDNPKQELELMPNSFEKAESFLSDKPETHARQKRVAELVEGFETAFGLELLASVHWVVCREGAQTIDEIIKSVHAWNTRKQQFSANQIRITEQTLREKGWFY